MDAIPLLVMHHEQSHAKSFRTPCFLYLSASTSATIQASCCPRRGIDLLEILLFLDILATLNHHVAAKFCVLARRIATGSSPSQR